MPLTPDSEQCGAEGCEIETHYYKIVWIPYPEGIRVSSQRGGRGKEARLFLCPEHYPMPEDEEYMLIGPIMAKVDEVG